MYATLICFLITSFIFTILGKTFINFFDKSEKYSIFDSFFIGLSFVGTILNFWSLFFPTNHYSLILLLLISLLILYKERKIYNIYFSSIKNKLINNRSILIITTILILFSIKQIKKI